MNKEYYVFIDGDCKGVYEAVNEDTLWLELYHQWHTDEIVLEPVYED